MNHPKGRWSVAGRTFLEQNPFLGKKEPRSAKIESLNPTLYLYTLQNFVVHFSLLPNVNPYQTTFAKMISYR